MWVLMVMFFFNLKLEIDFLVLVGMVFCLVIKVNFVRVLFVNFLF